MLALQMKKEVDLIIILMQASLIHLENSIMKRGIILGGAICLMQEQGILDGELIIFAFLKF